MQKNSGRQIRREIKGGHLGEKVGKKLGEKMGEKTGEKVGESLGEIHKLKLCRAFQLIPTLRTRPEYQLSADIHSHKAGTKLPHESALYLVWPRFFKKSTLFGYAQPW